MPRNVYYKHFLCLFNWTTRTHCTNTTYLLSLDTIQYTSTTLHMHNLLHLCTTICCSTNLLLIYNLLHLHIITMYRLAAVNSCPTLYELQYCSNSSRLPLVDHTDQFHQMQITPFYRGLCGIHRFTYSHQNSYTYRSHQPNNFHAESQSAPPNRKVGHVGLFGKRIQCNFMYSS